MHGCNGHMGQVISGLAAQDPQTEIVAGIDVADNRENAYPVFTTLDACQVEADAIIDFSNASAVDALMDYSAARQIPLVLCTTGLSEEQLAKVEETSKKVAVPIQVIFMFSRFSCSFFCLSISISSPVLFLLPPVSSPAFSCRQILSLSSPQPPQTR